ncbi:stalk domain-containing protein [Paenibacillus sp. HB172176]|uniref:stalk domain-containing protein n=1 Tax=Paenibacillus sp. HB172176 TaxID=2493690 RepID=UPI00143C7F61|nr:stalk domain-containing protein [Paenibacillus sp. HB172176]
MYSKLRNSIFRTTATVIIAGSLTTSGVLAAPSASSNYIDAKVDMLPVSQAVDSYGIVAIGDSLAAGYEMGFGLDSIPYGIGEHVYEQALFHGLRAEYANYGIIGLTTHDLNAWLGASIQQETLTSDEVPSSKKDPRAEDILMQSPQLIEDIEDAELILINIGGNDFLTLFDKLDEYGKDTAFNQMSADKQQDLSDSLDSLLKDYQAELQSILNKLAELAPNAEVIISNQYLPIPKLFNTYQLPASTVEFLQKGQSGIQEVLDAFVSEFAEKGLELIEADAAAAIEPSVLALTNIAHGDYHPNEDGYEALGKAFSKLLWDDYRTVQPRDASVPISVVVNGQQVITKYTPTLKKDRTFISLRDITDAIGADLEWVTATNTAVITLQDRTVEITLDAKTYVVNSETKTLNAEPAYMQSFTFGTKVEGKTFVPLAALSEGLGLQVVYRKPLQTAFINE